MPVAEVCANCSTPKLVKARPHCPNNPRCPWWTCEHCQASNDGQGNATFRDRPAKPKETP